MTAHKYIEENCYDLKMKYVKGLSQDMEDLTKKEGQLEAINFFKYFINSIENDIYEIIPEKQDCDYKCDSILNAIFDQMIADSVTVGNTTARIF